MPGPQVGSPAPTAAPPLLLASSKALAPAMMSAVVQKFRTGRPGAAAANGPTLTMAATLRRNGMTAEQVCCLAACSAPWHEAARCWRCCMLLGSGPLNICHQTLLR